MPWHAHLQLDYTHDGHTTGALDRHEGPLRVLQRLYPEGPGICHHVLVHPPGGIVGGDTLQVDARLASGAHALITTPGATRFYRSNGPMAEQRVKAALADGARLEWLPLETIAYTGCQVQNTLQFDLAPGAQMIGWDLLALGLPAAEQAFLQGGFLQQLNLPGAWLERGRIDAADALLLDAPLGWDGKRVLGTLWFAAGSALPTAQRDVLLDAAREQVATHETLTRHAGATAVHERVVVLRVLADRVEPAMALVSAVRGAWRQLAWSLAPNPPRIWRT
ncbi:MAG: urease accessory protein UreD [Burkholderiales bacterium]|nr:urease accessory protein UreD [Burkholderiales bacterium]